MKQFMKKRVQLFLAVAGATLVAVGISCWLFSCALPDYSETLRQEREKVGRVILDRKDRPLRLLPDAQGRLSLWTEIRRVPPCLKTAVLAAEDRRFSYHPGFDPIAILRALYINATRGRIVSGASTITQQAVRLLHPRPRTVKAKIQELLESMKMEWQLSKDEILELYLNLSPMGGTIRGVGLAAWVYFGKDIDQINAAEAACLAALPRSPTRYDPRRATGRRLLLTQKDCILRRMADLGWMGRDALKVLLGSSVDFAISQAPHEAPHFVDFVLSMTTTTEPRLKTTLDLDLQRGVERILRSHRNRLADMGIRQASALVISAREGEILGMVGSLDYGPKDQGYNNGVVALRGAGSTLKPFLYALALDRGHNAFSEIPDTFRSYPSPQGDYLPYNADRRSYGPVTTRSALGNSLNISAVKMIKSLGVYQFYEVLQSLGIAGDRTGPPGRYGLGLAIGNIEVSLYRLVQAYGALAREGYYRPLVFKKAERAGAIRVFSSEAAYVVSDILADPSARLLTFGNPDYLEFGFPVSLKTGTSSSFRDAWMIAYTPSHVVGVWAGNFDARPNRGEAGAAACGPIVKEILHRIYKAVPPTAFQRPRGVSERRICWMSGKFASPACPYTSIELFIGELSDEATCSMTHGAHQVYFLGAPYARWLVRREMEQGAGRFRLTQVPGSAPTMIERAAPGLVAGAEIGPVEKIARVSILSPHDHDHFVISAHREERIHFRALANPLVSHLTWLVDGIEIGQTAPPYELFWEPTRGTHRIHALTPDNEAARVIIHVE